MSAIINNSFRKFQADNFIGSFSTNNMYLAIGKNTAWSGASASEYTETTPSDTNIPVPIDTTSSLYTHYNDMIAAKRITNTSVSHVVKRVDWTSGTVYVEYDHHIDDIIDQNFFVFTEDFRVYKCISNGGGVASTVKPTGVGPAIIETSDNYRWKFMFEVQQADVLKFITTDWVPVNSPATPGQTDQANTEGSAVDGALEHIDVTAGGTGYRSNTGTAQSGSTTNTIVLAAGASNTDDYYNNMTVYISSGQGQGELKTISDYDGTNKIATVSTNWTTTPTNASVYEVMPAVTISSSDGSNAVARVSGVTAGVVTKVSMTNVGTGYRSATATVSSGSGSNAVLAPRIGPSGGHGKNAVAELGGAYVMLNARLIGADGSSDFPVGDDFRKVHLLINPKEAGGATATATTYKLSELQSDSGQIIYTEFRAPINRSADSTEDIKLVVEF